MIRDIDALYRFIAEREAVPFTWGRRANDCVSFAIGAAMAQGAADPLAGTLVDGAPIDWTDEASADVAIEAVGGLQTAFDARFASIAPAMAQRGDIGAVTAGNRMILVVIEGDMVVGPGPTGLHRLPRRAVAMAWRAVP